MGAIWDVVVERMSRIGLLKLESDLRVFDSGTGVRSYSVRGDYWQR